MFEDIVDRDIALSEDEYYDALLYLLGDAYPDLSEEELEDMLDDMLDRLPERDAENVMESLEKIARKIGTGAFKFVGDNPELVKTITSATGAMIGGPIGSKIGGEVGKFAAQSAKKHTLSNAGKTLALMQDPQVLTAVTRTAMGGVGNGTAPFTKNGKTSLIPAAFYFRSIIDTAQKALMELDQYGIIPPASLSEALPYPDDVDLQAEWLAEQLVGSQSSSIPPIKLYRTTYFIHSSGKITKYDVNNDEEIVYCFVDNTDYYPLGSFKQKKVIKRTSRNTTKSIEMVDIRSFYPFDFHGLKLGVKTWNSPKRSFINPDCLAALLGAMAENAIDDLRFNGASEADGSAGVSKSHINGIAFDLGYLRVDRSGKACHVGDENFDYERQVKFNNSLHKFGFSRKRKMLSYYFRKEEERVLLPHTSAHKDHFDHLHVQGFDQSLIESFSPLTSGSSSFPPVKIIGNLGLLKKLQISMPNKIYSSNQI